MNSTTRTLLLPLIIVASVIMLQACSTCDPVASLYVGGNATMLVNKEGVLERSTKPTAKYFLKAPGDTFLVEQGRAFELSMPDPIDLSAYALVVSKKDTVAAGPEYYKVALLKSCMPYIEMSDKCQVVNWYNPYRLPEVRIKNTNHQLVTTPLLSDSNEVIGYEVRLGTTDADSCRSLALDRFSERRKSLSKTNKKDPVVLKVIRSRPRKDPAKLAELIVVRPPS